MPSYRFNEYLLVPEARRLIRAGEDVAVGARVFDIVTYLVQNRARAVGRDELLSAVWGRTDGGDATLAQAVLKARRILGDDGDAQSMIRTVSRFGYQWAAPIEEVTGPSPPPSGAQETVSVRPAAATAAEKPSAGTPVARRKRGMRVAVAAFVVISAAVAAVVVPLQRSRDAGTAALRIDTNSKLVPGLVLVAPVRVRSASAEDGWMRLGVMSLSAQALAGVAGHAVVPDETALAIAARLGKDASAESLRDASRATVVITTEATRVGEDWLLNATVFNADGSAQLVGARADDAVAAATRLAQDLRELLAPEGSRDGVGKVDRDVLALAAHMKAAILEAQNGRALDLLAQAKPATAAAPAVVLLRAEALTQLGRTQEAIDALHALIDPAAAASWLPEAWTALGDCELARGHPAQAEAHFRRSIQLLGAAGDRRSLGLAWRGLGISQIVRNDLDGAEQSYLRARLELEPVGDRLLLARVTDGLGYIATTRGRMADALMLYEQAAAMGAAAGLNETELGSQLNIAEAHQHLLHHDIALTKLRELLPRIRAVDYPAMHRMGSIMYANALVETGASSEARQALAGLAESLPSDVENDAVVDVRLDQARVELALGDAKAALRSAAAVRAGLGEDSSADLRLETAALLLNAQAALGDADAARTLAAEKTLWEPANARAPARVHALVARAQWMAQNGDAAAAIDAYRQALLLAREFGTPVVLRDAAVPYAEFQLGAGALEAARETASVTGPYAEDDFPVALLLGRLASAGGDTVLARAYFTRARSLAGERWGAALDEETAGSELAGRSGRR